MAKLEFSNCREINAENYEVLSEIHLQQMGLAATLGFGKRYKTAKQFLKQSGDGDIEEGIVELWDVIDASKPKLVLYECWVYLSDTANVFFATTSKNTLAAMSQWSFGDRSEDGSNKELCDDLQKAFDNKK